MIVLDHRGSGLVRRLYGTLTEAYFCIFGEKQKCDLNQASIKRCGSGSRGESGSIVRPDFNEVLQRIEKEMEGYSGTEWANKVGVKINVSFICWERVVLL